MEKIANTAMLEKVFTQLTQFLNDHVTLISNELDNDFHLLKVAYQQLSKLGGLKLLIQSSVAV